MSDDRKLPRSDIPMFELSPSGVDQLTSFIRATGFGGDRTRPYVGQRWTWTGERGQPSLPTMTYRDLGDAIVEALRDFPGLERVDLGALAQTVLLRIEDSEEGEEG